MSFRQGFTRQLPSVREGYVVNGGSSTRQQAIRESFAIFGRLDAWYVSWLLEHRAAQEVERGEKRRRRSSRWAGIASGEREPIMEALSASLDYDGTVGDTADPLDRLLRAVDAVKETSPPEPDEACLTVVQAAERLGMAPATLGQRVNRGSVRSLKVGWKRLVPVAEVERLEAERVAA